MSGLRIYKLGRTASDILLRRTSNDSFVQGTGEVHSVRTIPSAPCGRLASLFQTYSFSTSSRLSTSPSQASVATASIEAQSSDSPELASLPNDPVPVVESNVTVDANLSAKATTDANVSANPTTDASVTVNASADANVSTNNATTDANVNTNSTFEAVSANSLLGAASIPSTQLSITEQILQSRIQAESKSSSDGSSGDSSSSDSGAKKEKQTWFQRHGWKIGLGVVSGYAIFGGGFLLKEWGAAKRDENGEVTKDEFSDLPIMEQYLRRCYREIILFKEMIQEPIRPKLLPDPLTEPYFQPPYTLVLEMTGVLVHPDWTYRTGWRFKKRPQVEHFLQQVTTPLFEIVIFTSEHAMTAYGIIDNLDPQGYIMYRLFRDSTNYKDGVYHKDISHLNRDPKRVIVVDWDETATSLQPENTLKGVERWTGDDNDKTLMDLAAFLRALAYSGVDDVRTVLAHYNQHDNPLAVFKENQRKLEEQQKQQQEMMQQEKKTLAGGAFKDLWGRRR